MNNASGENRSQRVIEAIGLAAIVATLWTLDTFAKHRAREIDGVGLDNFRLIAEQVTSAVSVYALIPVVAWWLSRFPLSKDRLVRSFAAHVVGSMIFATAHYAMFISMRSIIYPLFGETFVLSDFWFQNLLVEYQKDVKIYLAIILTVYLYRQHRQRAALAVDFGETMIVQTGTGECVINQNDIEYVEGSRNYATVHTAERELLVRQTLSALSEELSEKGFLRTHRSYIVNLQRVREFRPSGAGKWRVVLESGRSVPVSRGYKDVVRTSLGLTGSNQ